VGRRSQEFDADALTFFPEFAQKDHAAFQLVLCKRIRKNDHRAGFQFLIQAEQSAMRVYDNRVAGFAELSAVNILPFCEYANPHEYAGTSSGTFLSNLRHSTSMVGYAPVSVN
jgi:hypothetical protein